MDLRRLVRQRRSDILDVARRHGAGNVQLFGSVARGDPSPRDVDLLVDFEPGRSLFDHVALEQDLAELLGVKVDVVTRKALSKWIRESVLSEAVEV